MEQTKKSTFKLLFYVKKNEPKKNGNSAIFFSFTLIQFRLSPILNNPYLNL